MLQIPLLDYHLNIKTADDRTLVFDPARKKWVVFTPEEHVRQLLLQHLTVTLHYPLSLIAVEKGLLIAGKRKRFDIVVYERHTHKPWLLIECKAPDVPLTDATLQQLLHYHHQLQCRYWMVSNGRQHFCADAADTHRIIWINSLPAYEL